MLHFQKPFLYTALLIIVLIGCTYGESANSIHSMKNDSIPSLQTSIYNDLRDINHFKIKIGNSYFDSLYALLINSPNTKIDMTKDLCLGDNCESYQSISQDSMQVYFFKGDASEYGFSNDQFVLIHDSLCFVRNFNVNIEKWPIDNSQTLWKIEERIYYLNRSNRKSTSKIAFTHQLDSFDFTFKTVSSIPIKVNFESIYSAKVLELQELLDLKNAQELD